MNSYFIGTVKTEWLKDGRSMRLLDYFAFVDSNGDVWPAEEESIIDGASIPKIAWSVIGSPFVGKHRDASVPHDEACKKRTRPHEKVHRMYFEALLCLGVDEQKAQVMYHAVKEYGPKWDENGNDITNDQDHDVGDE